MYSIGNLLGKNKYYMKYILLLETSMDDLWICDKKYILKGSDDGVLHSELLDFWTFSIVQYSRD
jgi:hypothetical protein